MTGYERSKKLAALLLDTAQLLVNFFLRIVLRRKV